MVPGRAADVFDVVGPNAFLGVGDAVAARLLGSVKILFQRRDAGDRCSGSSSLPARSYVLARKNNRETFVVLRFLLVVSFLISFFNKKTSLLLGT